MVMDISEDLWMTRIWGVACVPKHLDSHLHNEVRMVESQHRVVVLFWGIKKFGLHRKIVSTIHSKAVPKHLLV